MGLAYEIIIDPNTGKTTKKILGGQGSSCHAQGNKLRQSCDDLGSTITKDGKLNEYWKPAQVTNQIKLGNN